MSDLRQVVAWRRPVQWARCIALWAVFVSASALPDLHLPLRGIAPIGFLAALLRTATIAGESRGWPRHRVVAGVTLGVDCVLLTGLLDITGGPFNPFVVVYAVDVWLAAATLSRGWAAAVGVVASTAFGWLVFDHLQAGLAEHHRLNDFPTHLFTMWFTGSTIAELVAHYVTRARVTFQAQQRALEEARDRAARSERLASLTTLAAGAAHELSTPLSTIAVAARELERALARRESAGDVGADVQLIQGAVKRCRAILDGMSGRAAGDTLHRDPLTTAAIAALACAELPPARRQRLTCEITDDARRIDAGADVSRALSSLLQNAFDAGGSAPVVLRGRTSGTAVRFEVQDQGPGMPDDVRRRAGEPFYTTKKPGDGLGLGLFLARTIVEQLGGALTIETGAGTTAIIEIPWPATVNA